MDEPKRVSSDEAFKQFSDAMAILNFEAMHATRDIIGRDLSIALGETVLENIFTGKDEFFQVQVSLVHADSDWLEEDIIGVSTRRKPNTKEI